MGSNIAELHLRVGVAAGFRGKDGRLHAAGREFRVADEAAGIGFKRFAVMLAALEFRRQVWGGRKQALETAE
jgi:hypothetical protein